MANSYDIRYRCPKCESLQIIGERRNFGTTDKDLDGLSVPDAYRIGAKRDVPQDILDLLQPDLRCKSCWQTLPDLTLSDLFVKRA